MLEQNRLKFIKSLGASTQSRVISTTPKSIDSPEMEILWDSYIRSKAFKKLVSMSTSNALDFNFVALLGWCSFLENNLISFRQDHISAYRQDILNVVNLELSRVLTNLKLYKVIPLLRNESSSSQVVLPKPDSILDPLAVLYGPRIKIILEYVPKKKNMVDLTKLQGPKLVKAGLDRILDQMQGYLFRQRGDFLSYNKPMSPQELMNLSEYQWFIKEGIAFRHNGSSLAILITINYPGVVPKSDSRNLLNNFHTMTQNVLRKIQ